MSASYLRGQAFPGTVRRLRRSQDKDSEKKPSQRTEALVRQLQRSRTGSEKEFSNLPMDFRERSRTHSQLLP